MDALAEFYDENVVMQDNQNPPTRGLQANREREEQFVGSIANIHENKALNVVADGDSAVIHWVLDFTNKQGARIRLDQLAFQTWENSKIVHEWFVYDSAGVVQAA
jgi:hypothetical protein